MPTYQIIIKIITPLTESAFCTNTIGLSEQILLFIIELINHKKAVFWVGYFQINHDFAGTMFRNVLFHFPIHLPISHEIN